MLSTRLLALLPPTQQNLTLLRSWLERPKYGKNFLQGIESKTWDPERGRDHFVMLSNQTTEQDVLFEALHKIIAKATNTAILGHRWKKPTDDENVRIERFSPGPRCSWRFDALVSIATHAFDFRAVLRQNPASKAGPGLGLCHDICHCTTTRCEGEAHGGFRCDCCVCDPFFFALGRLELMARDAAVQVVFIGSTTPS